MITAVVQRWQAQRASYRPAGETIDVRAFEVGAIAGDADAKRFVLAHHYAGTYPAARFRFGLYRGGALLGVAVFSHPCRDAVLTSVFPGAAREAVELGRFVLVDAVPANGETWFLARCFEQLRAAGIRGVVSFSDPLPRTDAGGARVFPGHIGTIYQAHNAHYLGRATARRLRLLPNGQVLSDRAVSKIRQRDQGWQYAVEQLLRAGAPAYRAEPAWLAAALAAATRLVRHPGNHRYAWPLDRRRSIALPRQAYPKFLAEAC